MSMDWLRWHHGTVNDPKWRVIARRAKSSIPVVLSVWAIMLENASQANPRGALQGWNHEDVAAALDLDASEIEAIHEAMQGKTLDGGRIIEWRRHIAYPGLLRPAAHIWSRIRMAVFSRDNFTCQYCGATNAPLECDHVVPVAAGGSHEMENLTTACRKCNRSKKDRLLSNWRRP